MALYKVPTLYLCQSSAVLHKAEKGLGNINKSSPFQRCIKVDFA